MRDPVDVAYDKSHYNQDSFIISDKELKFETMSQLDDLLANGDVLTDVILEEFTAREIRNFGNALANLIKCLSYERTEHIDIITDLFKFKLNALAAYMAVTKLENEQNHE